jgi:DNA-binding transcriptional MerR regulator
MPARNTQSDEYITPGQAQEELGVSTKTLAKLADDGVIDSFKLPSGHRRYSRESIDAIKAGDAA